MKSPIYLLLALFTLGACSNEPVFPVEPKIEYVDIQPREVRHLQDSILITFRFQDGDGNLGALEGQENFNLLLIDSRISQGGDPSRFTNQFTLPNLTPDVSNPSIQGDITVKLDFTANLPGQTEETIRYQIQLIDRDGNVAEPIDDSDDNAVWTDWITIRRN